MRIAVLVLFALLLAPLAELPAADVFLVENGQPRAEIVVAENPPRTARLAAHELQSCLERITGARLPIATRPTDGVPVQVYVGQSEHTDRLKITPEGLKHGAYRIVSGNNWLVLIGEDTEFTPIEPWARNNTEIVNGTAQQKWNRITGAEWGLPNVLIYKSQMTLPGDIGLPSTTTPAAGKLAPLRLWDFDERGSFNAVNGFLYRLGARWYLPGELGEVLPALKSIPLSKIDETVRPDFPQRRFSYHSGVHGLETSLWFMRLGVRDPYGIQDAHGLDHMTNRAEVFAKHPDWFALYGGKRRFDPNANNQLCYSNEELFEETVRYVRAQYDHFQIDTVSVMPPDGYTAICQCERCQGKDTPERGQRGLLSDYVWGFVNRVAREVRKTHPDRKVLNCAYGVYTLPPQQIDTMEPNVVVSIVGGRVPRLNKPQQQEEFRQLRESWVAKTHQPIIIFENYPFVDRGWYLPAFTPHAMGSSVNATKGISQGEDISLTVRQDPDRSGIGFNHFLVYFTARMYWGGKAQDVDDLLREYCRLFYGPAEAEMLAFFEHCEANWQEMEKDKAKVDRALELFAAAKGKTSPESVYGKRIALIDDFLKGLRNKRQQLAKVRGPVPVLRLVGNARSKIVIDGRLDEEAWVNTFPSETCQLRELQTGRAPTFGATVKAAWLGNNLYFAIRCDEHPGEKPNIGATRHDDSALWYGDAIEVLLETESRSYYQIAVSPSGAVADLDRSAARDAWFSWDSQAEVATQIADDHWTVEMRIPVIQDENDPLHQVIGNRPHQSLPWHINICRQRIRDDAQEYSAFSPTGTDHFHEVTKFATFYDGNSYEFPHGPPDDDFLNATNIAADLRRTGKRDEALAAYITAAEGKITDLQKSHALELAAAVARSLAKKELADELAGRIPLEAVKKAAQMQNLLDQYKAPQVVAQFAGEEIDNWPFWKRGDGYYARGRAYVVAKRGKEAEADLTRALEWISDPRTRDGIRLHLAQNRETNLQDDERALKWYREIVDNQPHLGTSDQFHALQALARILAKRRQFDDALAALSKVDPSSLQGFWRGAMLLSRAEVQQSAGRMQDVRATYQTIINDTAVELRHRQAAEERLKTLEK